MADLVVALVLKLVLPGIAASALATALGDYVLPPDSARGRWRPLATSLAVALGMAIANYLNRPLPYLPEDVGWEWLLPAAGAALLVGGIRTSLAPQWQVALATSAAVAALAAWRLFPEELLVREWLVPFVAIVTGTSIALERAAQRRLGAFPPACWGIVLAGGMAAVSILSHSGRFADAATLPSAGLAGAAFVGLFRPVDSRGLALAVALFGTSLMLLAYDSTNAFSEVPRASFLLTALAPMGTLILEAPRVRDWSPIRKATLEAVLLSVPVAIAVALAVAFEGV